LEAGRRCQCGSAENIIRHRRTLGVDGVNAIQAVIEPESNTPDPVVHPNANGVNRGSFPIEPVDADTFEQAEFIEHVYNESMEGNTGDDHPMHNPSENVEQLTTDSDEPEPPAPPLQFGLDHLDEARACIDTDVVFDTIDESTEPRSIYLSLDSLQASENYRREYLSDCAIAQQLSQASLELVVDYGEANGVVWRSRKRIVGWDLLTITHRTRTKSKLLTEREIASIGLQVAQAATAISEATLPDGSPADWIHARIGPSRILLDTDGHLHVEGLPLRRNQSAARLAAIRKILGPEEFAPEQLRDGLLLPQTDVYLCALTLQTLAVGKNPFKRRKFAETLVAVLEQQNVGGALNRISDPLALIIVWPKWS